MGTYRFLLAIAVVLSHIGITFAGGRNPGSVAVISFFLISGFVMTGLVRTHYSSVRKVHLYFLDRIARIFPQYLFFASLAAAGYFIFEVSSEWLTRTSTACVVANFLAIPLDFFMFSPEMANCMFIPQAWSLGLELTFYILFPVILIGGRRDLWLVGSLLVWFFAAWGVIDTDAWGYRLLPGTLFIFLLGSYIYDERQATTRHPAVRVFMLMIASAIALHVSGKLRTPYSYEVMAGLLIGVPALFILAEVKRTWWDDWFGNLSYGIFLCHFFVLSAFGKLGVPHDFKGDLFIIAASIALAYLGYAAIENPVVRWRRGLRQRRVRATNEL